MIGNGSPGFSTRSWEVIAIMYRYVWRAAVPLYQSFAVAPADAEATDGGRDRGHGLLG